MALKNYKDDEAKSNLPKLLAVLGILVVLFVVIYFVLGWRP